MHRRTRVVRLAIRTALSLVLVPGDPDYLTPDNPDGAERAMTRRWPLSWRQRGRHTVARSVSMTTT